MRGTLMFKLITSYLIRDKKSQQYTQEQISNGLDVLAVKVGRLAVAVEIVTPYFKDRKIKGKDFILPQSLVIILGDVIKFQFCFIFLSVS